MSIRIGRIQGGRQEHTPPLVTMSLIGQIDLLASQPYLWQWRIQDFPEVGAPTFQGAPTYDFAKFSQKLHEIERIWTPGGARHGPLDPSMFGIGALSC